MYSSIKQQDSTTQNHNYFCTNLIFFFFKCWRKWGEKGILVLHWWECNWWKVNVAQSCQTLCDPMDCSPWNSPGQNPGTESRSPTLQVDSLPAEPQCKPKNTGVGSLCLLLGNFTIQELSQGLPALQADSLPTLSGKPCNWWCHYRKH